MRTSKRDAITGAAVALVVIALIGIAAGSYFYFAAQSGTQTTTSGSTSSTTSSGTNSSMNSSTTTSTNSSGTTSSTTSTSISTSTCYSSNQSGASAEAQIKVQLIPLFQAVSQMSMRFNGTSSGSNFDVQASYSVVDARVSGNTTTYTVKINETLEGTTTTNDTAWVDSNGNIIAVDESGYNVTGGSALSVFFGLMTPFMVEAQFSAQLHAFTGSGFRSNGNSTATFGPTSMTVTDYSAMSLPMDVIYCGASESVTAFSLQTGELPGTSMTLVTRLHIEATSGSGYSNISIRLTSITKA